MSPVSIMYIMCLICTAIVCKTQLTFLVKLNSLFLKALTPYQVYSAGENLRGFHGFWTIHKTVSMNIASVHVLDLNLTCVRV